MKKLFSLFFVLAVAYSQCSGEASFPVPAVMGDSGNLVYISVKLIDGFGNVYITTIPPTGVSTQISAFEAAFNAFLKDGQDLGKCDVLVNIEGRELTNFVDGPSAGAAITVTTYSALTGKPLRNDSVLTGAILEYGEVGPVGGIFEKAKASMYAGKKFLLTPVNRLSDRLMLKTLEENSTFNVIEVSNIDEALAFLIDGKEIEQKNISALIRALPNITDYNSEGVEVFKKIALDMMKNENQTIFSMSEGEEELKEVKKYFINEISRQDFIFNKGYYFTSANDAFLNYIDAGTVSATKNIDVESKYEQVKSCLSGINLKQKTDKNFEYVIGAELREEWASQKMKEIEIDGTNLFEDKYFMFGEMMYADAWCKIATSFSQVETPKGKLLNESKLRDFAFSMMKLAEESEISSDELKDRLNNAQDLFEKGKYAASIYETTYALSMHKSDFTIKDTNKMEQETKYLISQNLTSFWGKVYQGHGVFLTQGSSEDRKSAYKILNYAVALDQATEDILALSSTEEIQNNNVFDFSCQQLFIISIVLFGFGLLFLIYFAFRKNKSPRQEKTRKYKNYKH